MALNKVDVWLPDALAVKYPNASKDWGWRYVFAVKNYSIDPRSKSERRHHVEEKQVQRYVKNSEAVEAQDYLDINIANQQLTVYVVM